MALQPAVFVDRDGTLNEECGYLTRPEQVRLLPGAGAAVRRLRAAGFACVVVTNQSAIGRGLMTEAALRLVHHELLRQLRGHGASLDGLYHCPAGPGEHPDRKPAPGMLLRAAADMGLDLARSWTVGDTARDILAGHAAGCRGAVLVCSGHDPAPAMTVLAAGDFIAADLAEAARVILRYC
jgi:D-glycero-D-manno-heptose 1,7-bisphosphate phosphatase